MTHKSYWSWLIARERMLRLNSQLPLTSLLPSYLAPSQNLQSVARGSITFSIDSKRQQQTFSRHCCWEGTFSARGFTFTFTFTTSSDLLPSLGELRLPYPTSLPCLKDWGTWEHNVADVNFTWPRWYNRVQQKRFLIYIKLQPWVISMFYGSNLSLWRVSGRQVNALYCSSVICSQTSTCSFQRLQWGNRNMENVHIKFPRSVGRLCVQLPVQRRGTIH